MDIRIGPLLFVVLIAASCATGPKQSSTQDGETPLFVVPPDWELVNEREGDTLYQANLRNNRGPGRILIGRLQIGSDTTEVESYLYKLHTDLVERIQGEADLAPFSEDRLAWQNGLVGYRTKMRGELGRDVVIVEGITLSDGERAYFHYGLFPESSYQSGRQAYAEVLRTLGPIRGEEQIRNRGLEIAGSSEPTSTEVGSDGATAAQDYHSPATHLGMAAWGATREQIEGQAGLPLREGPNAVGYRCQFLGAEDCVVIYMFDFGQLTHGGYLLESDLAGPQDHVARYLRMTKKLTEQYGRPEQSAAIWIDPEYRNEGAMWGEALAQEQVIFGTVWKIGSTKVVHSLRNQGGEIQHRILLSNDELREKLQAQAGNRG